MKTRPAFVHVSDHAVLRWLEREHGLPVEAIRKALRDSAQGGAELAAAAIQIGRIKMVLVDEGRLNDGSERVTVTTCLARHMSAARDKGQRDDD